MTMVGNPKRVKANDDPGSEGELIRIGFEIAPVPMKTQGRDWRADEENGSALCLRGDCFPVEFSRVRPRKHGPADLSGNKGHPEYLIFSSIHFVRFHSPIRPQIGRGQVRPITFSNRQY